MYIPHQGIKFDNSRTISKLMRCIGARVRLQKTPYFPEKRKIPRIENLLNSFVTLRNIMFDNG